MLKLFKDIITGQWFHFGDQPSKKLIKSNGSHYVGPTGRRKCDPDVLVFTDDIAPFPSKSIFDQEEKEDG